MNTCDRQILAPSTCAEKLQAALARYHDLMIGGAEITSVRNGDESVTFGAAKYNLLKPESLLEYIRSLNQACPCREAHSLLAPMNRGPAYMTYAGMHMESRMGCRHCG